MESERNGKRFKVVWDEGDERHVEKGTLVDDEGGLVRFALNDGRTLYVNKRAIIKMLELEVPQ
jgi:hypothetical protein